MRATLTATVVLLALAGPVCARKDKPPAAQRKRPPTPSKVASMHFERRALKAATAYLKLQKSIDHRLQHNLKKKIRHLKE